MLRPFKCLDAESEKSFSSVTPCAIFSTTQFWFFIYFLFLILVKYFCFRKNDSDNSLSLAKLSCFFLRILAVPVYNTLLIFTKACWENFSF